LSRRALEAEITVGVHDASEIRLQQQFVVGHSELYSAGAAP
jgi:hypothetical protein